MLFGQKLITLLRSIDVMQKEWITIDINVLGIIKQLLTLFLGYMMFGKCRGSIVNPWLLMLPSSFALG